MAVIVVLQDSEMSRQPPSRPSFGGQFSHVDHNYAAGGLLCVRVVHGFVVGSVLDATKLRRRLTQFCDSRSHPGVTTLVPLDLGDEPGFMSLDGRRLRSHLMRDRGLRFATDLLGTPTRTT